MSNQFDKLFKDHDKKVFMPFFTLGDPSFDESLHIISTAIDSGVEAIELGFPFSDPIADGPTNQRSMERALKSGMTFDRCIEMLSIIRQKYPDIAIGLLIYYNLLFKQGESAYQKLSQVGIDGVVCADLPLEESKEHEALLKKYHIGAVQMVAPNSSDERVKQLASRSSAFNYVLSGFGTTGAKSEIAPQTIARIKHVRALIDQPMVVGFGISKPEHVHAVWQAGGNAAIVGSYFTSLIEQHLSDTNVAADQIRQFIKVLK
ncbi:tryptophan synthase subunit alpha [Cysteiniphilum sp. QT6929]|uniref:tryptophan synthase subunit alpha n=1 Tax=Cysteiniphilum sp. QT6929 TaxID=2975055 RepID=UPI0024B39863|nr:tryptophan synthase subunit alpha [Cysteiniphilum sp. QT6929]WHN65784.1 tryptophan synthase subunit alpha [Cysteiniphilum sp. QT6929]